MIEELKKSAFFVGLDERAIEAIAGFTTRVTFEANEIVFGRDDEARYVYEVVQGRVRQGFEVMPGSMVLGLNANLLARRAEDSFSV